jgi:hypothetical protein
MDLLISMIRIVILDKHLNNIPPYTTSFKHHTFFTANILFNALPLAFKQESNLIIFKRKLKEFIVGK